jgi:hypothetical protein
VVGCCQDVSSLGGCSSPCQDLATAAVQRLSGDRRDGDGD